MQSEAINTMKTHELNRLMAAGLCSLRDGTDHDTTDTAYDDGATNTDTDTTTAALTAAIFIADNELDPPDTNRQTPRTKTAPCDPADDDLVTSYLCKLARYKLLTPTQELALARAARTGDRAARTRLVESN